MPAAEPVSATKEQYLACLVAQSFVEARKSRFADEEKKYKAFAAKFQAAEASLAAQVKKHAPSNRAEIESYNKAVASRNQTAQSLNAGAEALQRELAAVNKLVVETNSKCGGLLVSAEVAQAAEEEFRRRGEPQ